MSIRSDVAKRAFDFTASLLSLVVLSPLLVALALLVRASSRGPVFYRGMRVGLRGKPFRIFKFRSMVVDAEQLGGSATAEDDPRINSIGKTLRKYKLDELPQLINVLKGEMSLVGPRPEVHKYVNMYSEEERAILELRPGITDWASIWDSNEAAVLEGSKDPEKTYEELIRPTKIALQLLYARDHSLFGDVKILFYTLLKLFREDWLPQEIAPYGRVRRYRLISQEPS